MKAATLQSPGIERPNGTEFTHSIGASKGALAIALVVGVALALATWPLYSEVSLWLAPVIVVMTGVLAHMIVASSFCHRFRTSALSSLGSKWSSWHGLRGIIRP